MRDETYETRVRFSYRPVLITLTSHLVVIDFRQGRISTAENRPNAFIDLGLSGIPRIGPRKRPCIEFSAAGSKGERCRKGEPPPAPSPNHKLKTLKGFSSL